MCKRGVRPTIGAPILMLDRQGAGGVTRAKKLVATKHEERINELLGPANRTRGLEMLGKDSPREF